MNVRRLTHARSTETVDHLNAICAATAGAKFPVDDGTLFDGFGTTAIGRGFKLNDRRGD